MRNIKVSFDFDDTLSNPKVERYAKELIAKGIEVHITTSRFENPKSYAFNANHEDLNKVANRLGITKDRIHFTNFTDKASWFKMNLEYDFLWHLDDNVQELLLINSETSIRGIDSIIGMWKEKCNKLIDYELTRENNV